MELRLALKLPAVCRKLPVLLLVLLAVGVQVSAQVELPEVLILEVLPIENAFQNLLLADLLL
jgi:hypothetical protein